MAKAKEKAAAKPGGKGSNAAVSTAVQKANDALTAVKNLMAAERSMS